MPVGLEVSKGLGDGVSSSAFDSNDLFLPDLSSGKVGTLNPHNYGIEYRDVSIEDHEFRVKLAKSILRETDTNLEKAKTFRKKAAENVDIALNDLEKFKEEALKKEI